MRDTNNPDPIMDDVNNSIVVVEDDPVMTEALRDVLEEAGYQVRTASHGQEALELIIEDPPELIISEVSMPDMSGIELFKAVHQESVAAPISFIFLAESDEVSWMVGLGLDADEYLTKPFTSGELLGLSGKVLHHKYFDKADASLIVVDDDPTMLIALRDILERTGYRVRTATHGKDALDLMKEDSPELIISDFSMPFMNGVELVKAVRQKPGGENIPFILLTAGNEVARLDQMGLGEESYFIKPITSRELVARVRATLDVEVRLVIDDRFQINLAGRTVWVDGQLTHLTPEEFDLLAFMAGQRGRVFGRDMLLGRIWGEDDQCEPSTVDSHIQCLREKIEIDPQHPRYILAVHTIGYKFSKGS